MNLFGKDYAAIYDALYKDQQFLAEARAVSELAAELVQKSGKADLLDLGCGTGNHSQYFKKDFNVVGVDLSDEMLAIARQKVPEVKFQQGNARTFNLDQQFDVVAMMSAVLGYQHANEEVIATLRNVRSHLRPGGMFVFDVWYGPAILLEKPAPRLREISYNGTHILRSMTPKLCAEKSTVTCHYKWWVPTEGKLETREEWHTQRYFFPNEVKLLLEMTGFQLFRFGRPGHAYRPIEDLDRDVMFVAKAVG
jgi:SAM-dependent methyltransferase